MFHPVSHGSHVLRLLCCVVSVQWSIDSVRPTMIQPLSKCVSRRLVYVVAGTLPITTAWCGVQLLLLLRILAIQRVTSQCIVLLLIAGDGFVRFTTTLCHGSTLIQTFMFHSLPHDITHCVTFHRIICPGLLTLSRPTYIAWLHATQAMSTWNCGCDQPEVIWGFNNTSWVCQLYKWIMCAVHTAVSTVNASTSAACYGFVQYTMPLPCTLIWV